MTIFIIGKVWPEPKSSAAGSRMMQLIQLLIRAGHTLHFASAASHTNFSESLDDVAITTHEILLNDSSFDDLIKSINPDVVIYDRFMTEEQYGWRVHEHCPSAMTVLNTEDLHFLRSARSRNPVKPDFHHDDTWRELSSIFRSDLNLIISEAEMDILIQEFSLDKDRLFYLPLLYENQGKVNSFKNRSGYCTVGNFLHHPNLDAVKRLKTEIWPLIRSLHSGAQLHIYGAYCPESIKQMHKPEEGFHVEGRAYDVHEILNKHRLMLAPLEFGAGLKGKLLESMINGLPSITTSVGAEGITGDDRWPGFILNDWESFAKKAVSLYSDEEYWVGCQMRGFELIRKRFSSDLFETSFVERLSEINENLSSHRKENYIGAMLRHQNFASTKFMGKWIEDKNKGRGT